jgi:hypothetical protein
VPAAAVIRRFQALSGVTGRKELRRRHSKRVVKSGGSTINTLLELLSSRVVEVPGISSVGVKSVDIRRNTNGVGRVLDYF